MKKRALIVLILLAVFCLWGSAPSLAEEYFGTTFPAGCDADEDGIPDGWTVQDSGTGGTGWYYDESSEGLRSDITGGNGLITYDGTLNNGTTSAGSLTDYMVTSTGRLAAVGTDAKFGVVARYVNSGTFYTSRIIDKPSLNYQTLSMYRFVDGSYAKLGDITLPNGDEGYGHNASLSLAVSGSQVVTLVRDETNALVGGFMVNDSSPVTSAGTFGARSTSTTIIEDYTVDEIPSGTAFTYLTTAEGNGADTYVELLDGADAGNMGSGTSVKIKSLIDISEGGRVIVRKAYLRFDVSEVEGDIVDGFLSLGSQSPGNRYNLKYYGLNDQDAGENWDESTISYANAPGNTSVAECTNDMDLTAMTYLGEGYSCDSTTMHWTFGSTAFQEFLTEDTDGLVTIAVTWSETATASTMDLTNFDTSESAASVIPRLGLITQATTVPEPSVLMLVLAALPLLVLGRRKLG